MKFYTYRQNNSGGEFLVDEKVAHTVIVEAPDALSANARAQAVGVYFDGCETGPDCSCCGDRWSRAYEGDDYNGCDAPSVYGEDIRNDGAKYAFDDVIGRKQVRIHYADGRVVAATNASEVAS
jgi:hypothetical protein